MKINYWKVGVFAAIVLALMYWAHSCGVRSVIVKVGKTDTVWAKPEIIRIDTGKTKLVKVIKWIPQGTIVVDSIIREVQPVDSAAILEAYNSAYLYYYQERFKYGSVEINDTVSQNQFLGRGLTFILDSIPIVTKTVLLTQPKKTILYFGGSVYGNRNLNFGAGVDLSLKGRNDKIYGVGILYTNQLYYGLTYKIPIRLKKK